MEEIGKVIDENRQGEALMMDGKAEGKRKLYLESYGCAMNFADSEIVASILHNGGFATTKDFNEADVIFVNTCSIRDNAEQRVRQRLTDFKKAKKKNPELVIGVLGCMAERLKEKFLEEEKLVDLVVGPDAYRDIPNLLAKVESGQKAVNVILSKEETYADISPVRIDSNGVTAFVSIMRGCDNMCSFCVVPFTRGRERSRNPESIIAEVKDLFERGYREVTLLGQNVYSYIWAGGGLKKDISTTFDADVSLPVQSGSSRILELMNRGYTREWYMERILAIRKILPDCGISADIISGFCTETEEDHQETLSLMKWAQYDFSFMFFYSERPNTAAERKLEDDIPEEIKKRRLAEVIELQKNLSEKKTLTHLNKTHRVLIERTSKRDPNKWAGRNSQNIVVVFPKGNYKIGEYADVFVDTCTATTLIGKVN
ncbi:MAG: MiaB/RimO family radical SAM methylthiotransferase [Bacteroidetes bacterium]|nr:MiaB/RimO family radical SAM methylthiotransferase [Bacteroidota bacterium]